MGRIALTPEQLEIYLEQKQISDRTWAKTKRVVKDDFFQDIRNHVEEKGISFLFFK